jgi:hypothetical protein
MGENKSIALTIGSDESRACATYRMTIWIKGQTKSFALSFFETQNLDCLRTQDVVEKMVQGLENARNV